MRLARMSNVEDDDSTPQCDKTMNRACAKAQLAPCCPHQSTATAARTSQRTPRPNRRCSLRSGGRLQRSLNPVRNRVEVHGAGRVDVERRAEAKRLHELATQLPVGVDRQLTVDRMTRVACLEAPARHIEWHLAPDLQRVLGAGLAQALLCQVAYVREPTRLEDRSTRRVGEQRPHRLARGGAQRVVPQALAA